jgi:hypothetical protein
VRAICLLRQIEARGTLGVTGAQRLHTAYQLTHRRGRTVTQIDDVRDLRQWQPNTVSDTLHIRAADEVFSQLTDAQTVQKEVTLVGRLGSDHVLDVTGIRIHH